MPWCPNCKTEYQDGYTVCSDCGSTLVESLEQAATEEAVSYTHLDVYKRQNNDSDTTPVPQDNTAEPADAFLSGMQAPVTSQPQADVYQDMKEVHYLEPKQPQQTEAFVPLESRVETSAPEVTLHMDTQLSLIHI